MTRLATTPALPGISGERLTPEQTRFNTLIRQIAQARQLIADWQHHISLYRTGYVKVQVPLQQEMRALMRDWIVKADAMTHAGRWSRTERQTWVGLVCEAAEDYLEGEDDPEIKAIFSRHAEVDFDAERAMELQVMKAMAEKMSGLDLGEDEGIASEEDLFLRMKQAQAEAQRAQAEAHAAQAQSRRKTKAEKKREAESEAATLSVREIFRKLASALHPDRETDPVQRAEKTALMQQANQAYAANDLLALLELQLRIEQVDASHLAGADTRRIKHYNKVLTEQLKELRGESERVALQFTMEFGLDPSWRPSPKRLGEALAEQSRRLRSVLDRTAQELRMFEQDPATTKRWLKGQRARFEQEAFDMDDLF
jgi:uncharacterized protein YifE (UPF0438 family)